MYTERHCLHVHLLLLKNMYKVHVYMENNTIYD